MARGVIVFAVAKSPGGLYAEGVIFRSTTKEKESTMTSTKDIHEAVEAELSFDPLVDATDITVKNINGEVALNGTVASYPQYLEAATAAQRVAGVKQVHNHLAVQLPDGDYRDDAQLATAANNALLWDVTVPDGIEATARNGNLTLTGTVNYGSQRTAAELAVGGLTGVRNVKDEIGIDYDAIDPVDVTALVQDALDRNALILDDSDVVVDTTGNTVTLTGHVRTWAEHDAAIDAAWMASGVYDVIDNLLITG
jgi:osmotically-inducible protein OsmY